MSRRNLQLTAGAILSAMVLLMVVAGMFYAPHPPNRQNLERRLEAPSRKHWLGTDHFGRDILSRILVGGRPVLQAGLVAVCLGLSLGILWGALAGFYGGLADEILMRLADGLYALPSILMALLAVTLLGPGQPSILIAVAIANIPIFARLTRACFLELKEREFVLAAKALGSTNWRIIFYHILPNAMPTLLVQASVSFAATVLAEASLSYLGLGIQPPHASWGRMLREAQAAASIAPWTTIFPGLMIALTVLGFNQLGDGLRNAFDPRRWQ